MLAPFRNCSAVTCSVRQRRTHSRAPYSVTLDTSSNQGLVVLGSRVLVDSGIRQSQMISNCLRVSVSTADPVFEFEYEWV